MHRYGFFVLLLGFGLGAAGCGSGSEVAVSTPDDRFAKAVARFDNGDYLEAINEFTVITLQYPGSSVAADAQFYLGECRFRREEYVLAAFEYSVLKRNYPASTRVPEGQYRLALCYYELSPRSSLDQEYTRKAIDELQAFVEYYPGNERATDAEEKIRELTNRLARKQYDTARLYAAMQYSRAALLSYDTIIEKYHDTDYAPLAYLEKAELLIDRERFTEAATALGQFITKYPNSVLRVRAERLLEDAEEGKGRTRDARQGSRAADSAENAEKQS
jgi:outer membrane protein assembly factor BamD